MENTNLRSRLLTVLLSIVFSFQVSIAAPPPQVAAMFVFGDSLNDNGNNNYLNSLAKANYDPYGIDYDQGFASGRFSNGKTIIDYLGDLLGLPLLPTYAATGTSIMQGVNYASASAGILEETGRNLGERISFRQQVENFASNLPFSSPCINRDQHVFWDAFHPTQAANQILAGKAYNGPPSDCYPMNVKQMAEL